MLDPYVPGIPLAVFLIGVSAATFYGGLGPDLVATALSALLIDYHLESPYASFTVSDPTTSLDLVIFSAAAVAISWFNASLGRARTRVEIASAKALQPEQQSILLAEFSTAVNSSLDSDAVGHVLAAMCGAAHCGFVRSPFC